LPWSEELFVLLEGIDHLNFTRVHHLNLPSGV
jgi:hypothetical protein